MDTADQLSWVVLSMRLSMRKGITLTWETNTFPLVKAKDMILRRAQMPATPRPHMTANIQHQMAHINLAYVP